MTRSATSLAVLVALVCVGAPAEGRQIQGPLEAQGPLGGSDPPSGPTPSAPPATSHRTAPVTLDQVLELSGLRAQLPGILGWIAQEYQLAHGALAAEDRVAASRVLARGLRHDRVYATLTGQVRDLDQATLDEAATWYRSPLGLRITTLETEVSSGKHASALEAYGEALEERPALPERVELVERLDGVSGGTSVSTEILMTAARSLLRAVNDTLPPERRLRPSAQDVQLRVIRARALDTVRRANQITMLYTYRSLTDDELREYVQFLGSDTGRIIAGRVKQALLEALGVAAGETARELVRAVPPERWAPTPIAPSPEAR